MLQNLKTISDYVDVIKRRKNYIVITWFLISAISVVVAFYLPKTYRSTANLLIEAPIPTNIVESTVSQYADLQIHSIYQRSLTTNNIISIIESNGLYKDLEVDGFDKHELVEQFKKNLEIGLTTSSLIPQAAAGKAEVAFDISFSDAEANKAQEIVSRLVTLFIEENDKARAHRANTATGFLLEESEKLKNELQEIDNRIAQFKEQHNFRLPEQMQGNLAAIDRTENELRDTEIQIRATKERIVFLETELARALNDVPANLNDKAPQSKNDTLRILQAKYLRLSSIYAPSHPSLTRLVREINALDPDFGGRPIEDDVLKELNEARHELKLLEESSSGNHPEITQRRKQVERLEQQLKNMSLGLRQEKNLEDVSSTNPAFLGVQAQYKSSQFEFQSLLEKQSYLKEKLEKMQSNLLQAPQVEMAYNHLIRIRDNTIKKYTQLKEKLLDAKLVQSLEEQQQGQTLTVLEQPIIPRHPEKAIRRKVAIGGFFMGIIAGLGIAFFIELLEPGIRGYRAITEITGLMPLVVVPYIETPSELEETFVTQSRIRKIVIWTGITGVILATAVICVFFFPSLQA